MYIVEQLLTETSVKRGKEKKNNRTGVTALKKTLKTKRCETINEEKDKTYECYALNIIESIQVVNINRMNILHP